MATFFLLALWFVAPAAPRLRVTPQVCHAPCEVTILSHRTAKPEDREWTLALYAEGEDIADRSSVVSLEGERGDTSRRVFWGDIPSGTYTVTSCVTPTTGCASAHLVVH